MVKGGMFASRPSQDNPPSVEREVQLWAWGDGLLAGVERAEGGPRGSGEQEEEAVFARYTLGADQGELEEVRRVKLHAAASPPPDPSAPSRGQDGEGSPSTGKGKVARVDHFAHVQDISISTGRFLALIRAHPAASSTAVQGESKHQNPPSSRAVDAPHTSYRLVDAWRGSLLAAFTVPNANMAGSSSTTTTTSTSNGRGRGGGAGWLMDGPIACVPRGGGS